MIEARHNLCYLLPSEGLNKLIEEESNGLLQNWIFKSRPLVFTRQPDTLEKEKVQLAAPYLDIETLKKTKFSFILDHKDIAYITSPPSIKTIFPQLNKMDFDHIKVFGSYCWEFLTNEKNTHHQSDLDLLIQFNNTSASCLKNTIGKIRKYTGIKTIDGEIRFQQLGDCAANELLHSQSKSILFKSIHQVTLIDRSDLYERFPALIQK